MRLHLDTSSAGAAVGTGNASSASATGKSTGPNAAGINDAGNSRDSVAVSGASSAWSASFADRAARVSQLAAAVQSGGYRVSSAAIGQSIVASAFV